MRAVNISIRHDDDAVVAKLLGIEILTHACSDRRDQRGNLFMTEHPVWTRFLNVEYLAAQWEYGLELTITALLGRTACRFTLNDVQLRTRRVLLRTVRQLTRQCAAIHRILADYQVARLLRRLTRSCRC